MKKLFLLGLVILLFAACEQKDTRYTQNSPEIDMVKKVIEDYNSKDYNMNVIADTSKTFFNNKKNPMSKTELVAYHKANDANYSKRGFTGEDPEYEMVVTDDGETWVNAWLDWQATLKGSGKVIDMPVHLTYRFADGKIVRQVGMWDPTEVILGLQEIEAEKAMSVDEKTIKSTIDAVVKAWNANDQKTMATLMTDDMVRTANGTVVAKSPAEYGSNLMDVFFTGFPDFKVTLDDYKIIGNKAIINWTCTGTNTGTFQGKSTNKPIKTHGLSIWTIEKDGRASREDAYYDNLTLFQQLGYMPELQ
ncbi:nuclear transport factor 2 family protein [Winogradskyella schleiferi]|uniref:nuclear transport factor 2 family protein n=1 Tax=Winogradskyella schleiferi TaxID=2686078 RepID=UPI0015B8AD4E|nr:nuclear transport factor 2 family protein [Winogradskyella schleiferi]